ncbi:MAG: urate hydroxylase PuuD [Candidatus Omnitrophica bacterium]|nr:urate hydroxylase PuuD [Candidatus Omnitrophota bacterium]
MALTDWFSNVSLLLRWLHVIAGITWIGHLYFFNFVNVPLQGSLDDAAKKAVNPKLMPRALWWFRWGAMITFLSGLVMFTLTYMYTPGEGFGSTSLFLDIEGNLTGRATWILFGMLLATIMWFNVWFIIWPAQKKMLKGQVPQDQLPGVRKRALLASRTNTFLSGPMLFGMLAPAHYGASNALTLGVAAVLGLIAIWWAIRASAKVGVSV